MSKYRLLALHQKKLELFIFISKATRCISYSKVKNNLPQSTDWSNIFSPLSIPAVLNMQTPNQCPPHPPTSCPPPYTEWSKSRLVFVIIGYSGICTCYVHVLYGYHVTTFVFIFKYIWNKCCIAIEENLFAHAKKTSSYPCIPNCPWNLWWSDLRMRHH